MLPSMFTQEKGEPLKQKKSKQREPFVVLSVAVTPKPDIVQLFTFSQTPQFILYIPGSNLSQELTEIISITEE